jgi:putative Holliday junction resolvase
MGQVLAVDYGTRRLGIAVSDSEGRYAMPVMAVEEPARRRAAAVAQLARERDVECIVIGRPRRHGGEDSNLWPEIESFGRSLVQRGFEVVYEDEAFTSTEADERLNSTGTGRRPRGRTDAVAASVILQQYLDRQRDNASG